MAAEVEPRTSLADFLREHQALTGTHVGCEHGVCGACTIWIDGAPARSCITFAASADGAEITTLEGFETDPVMDVLREEFSANHGLQCGFCTPGMLMSARDIITRLPDADEKRIRLELSGNLCRCTGYVGIVHAVQSALAKVKASGLADRPARKSLGPVGSHRPAAPTDFLRRRTNAQTPIAQPSEPIVGISTAVDWTSVERDGIELRQSFEVPFARADVWRFFSDLDQVARCMPGARLTGPEQNGRTEGEVSVKLGPIVSIFAGSFEITRDAAAFRGIVRGAGRDTKSTSNARAIISYALSPAGAAATRTDVSVKFLLSGPLAQFSRSGLIRDVADHLTRVFARNLEARLSGRPADATASATLDAGHVARAALWARIGAILRRVFGGWGS